MAIDYSKFAIPKIPKGHQPIRGARAAKRARIANDEVRLKRQSKKRDGNRCRWPRQDHDTPGHKCIGRLESAHRVPKGMGGDKDGSRTSTKDLLTTCVWIHQDSPDALEKKGRTWQGSADGPVAFVRRGKVIARERSIGLLE
jgi:hypothetical protein